MSALDRVKQKASSKQIAMLVAIAHGKGLDQMSFLEWLEFDSGLEIEVARLDDIRMMDVSDIKSALESMG